VVSRFASLRYLKLSYLFLFQSETNVGLGSSSDDKEETSALSNSEDSDNEDLQDLKVDVVPEQVSDYSISDQVKINSSKVCTFSVPVVSFPKILETNSLGF
jgi:hypothetical protein